MLQKAVFAGHILLCQIGPEARCLRIDKGGYQERSNNSDEIDKEWYSLRNNKGNGDAQEYRTQLDGPVNKRALLQMSGAT